MTRLLVSLLFLCWTANGVSAGPIQSHKDQLFAYPPVIREEGGYKVVAYDEMRDINGRDVIPEKRVKPEYVTLGVKRADLVLESDGLKIAHIAAGHRQGASFIVIYLHGQGGNRLQGASDLTFGGNFNRIQNLADRSGGLYLSPDFPDFGKGGIKVVKALAAHYLTASPRAKLVVACGSMGGQLCWQLAGDSEIGGKLGGLILLGSMWDDAYSRSPAFKARVPVFLGHGSRDTVFAVDRQEAFFRSILAEAPGYPVRFVRFETGSHGTPIRMTDWRETLNWMLK